MTDDWIPHQSQITDHIENLVANEFVFEPQGTVEHAGLAQDNCVVEGGTKREAFLAKHLSFFEKTKRPSRCDLIHKRGRSHTHRP